MNNFIPNITEETQIFTCGDIHGNHDINKLNTTFWPEQNKLKDAILIQAGDFGIIWENEPNKTENYWLNWLNNKNFYTLFIGGNHENHARLNDYPVIDFYGGKASVISDKVFHLKNGYVYNFGGKKFWLFGGALSIDKDWRVEGKTWWPEEIPDYKTMQMGLDNLENEGNTVDYIITHTIPKQCVQILKQKHYGNDYQNKINDPVAAYLDEVLDRMLWGYKHWYAGHFHEDTTLNHYNLTIMYNKIIEIN